MKNFMYICSEKSRSGEVSLPFGCQIQTFSLILIFQILRKIVASIGLRTFRFSYSLQGFRNPLCNPSLITLQRYGIILKYANKIKIVLLKNRDFFACFFINSQTHKLKIKSLPSPFGEGSGVVQQIKEYFGIDV